MEKKKKKHYYYHLDCIRHPQRVLLCKKLHKSYDLTVSEIPLLILCLIVPIVTHFATWVTYAHLNNGVNNSKILFKKRIK